MRGRPMLDYYEKQNILRGFMGPELVKRFETWSTYASDTKFVTSYSGYQNAFIVSTEVYQNNIAVRMIIYNLKRNAQYNTEVMEHFGRGEIQRLDGQHSQYTLLFSLSDPDLATKFQAALQDCFKFRKWFLIKEKVRYSWIYYAGWMLFAAMFMGFFLLGQ